MKMWARTEKKQNWGTFLIPVSSHLQPSKTTGQEKSKRASQMTSTISVIEEDILAIVRSKAARVETEREVSEVVLSVICDRFVDPRAVPLDDIKLLLVHAMASYRHDAGEHAQIAV